MVADVAAVVGAVVAGLAALFSGATLWVTGKREERAWRRDAITETLVGILDASFSGTRWQLVDGRERIGDRPGDAAYDDVKFQGLTRLRLIAPNTVVAAAIALHVADRRLRVLGANPGTAIDLSRLESFRSDQSAARRELLNVARKTIGLNKALDDSLVSKQGLFELD